MAIQLEFFARDPLVEIADLKKEVKKVEDSTEKVRKGIYAKHGELKSRYEKLHARLEILEKNICRGITM
jgi:hypothetical protein